MITPLYLIFYFFSALAVFSGVMVIASGSAMRSVLFLVLTFFSMSALWLLLNAEFLALILVLVYVGAVMTLFLFVLMMLRTSAMRWREGLARYLPWIGLLVLMLIGVLAMILTKEPVSLIMFRVLPVAADYNNLADLGSVLYTSYVYPFELAAVILLMAMVAAIALTRTPAAFSKTQNPHQQMAVKVRDRLKLIKDGDTQ